MTCMFSTVMSILEKYHATSMRRLYSGDKGAQNIYLIELGSDTDVDLAIAELRNDPEIRAQGAITRSNFWLGQMIGITIMTTSGRAILILRRTSGT